MAKPIEYRFTLPDGSERFEFVDPDGYDPVQKQITMFMQMHGAVKAEPVR